MVKYCQLPLETVREELGLDKDDIPYDVELKDDGIKFKTAGEEERPPKASICGYSWRGYTLRVTYNPKMNNVRLTHSGPSVNFEMALDEFEENLTRRKVLSDIQYDRAKAYINREWDRHTCSECGKLLLDEEIEMVKNAVRHDHPDLDSYKLCESHQTTLYDLMEYNPWSDPEKHTPGANNSIRGDC